MRSDEAQTGAEAYEYRGVIYHEKLPRILLINFPDDYLSALKGTEYNIKTLVHKEGTLYHELPWDAQDIDIIFLYADETRTTKNFLFLFHGNVKHDPQSFGMRLPKKKGFMVTFVGAQGNNILGQFFSEVRLTGKRLVVGETAHKFNPFENQQVLCDFILGNFERPLVYHSLTGLTHTVIADTVGRSYAGFLGYNGYPSMIFLPIYPDVPKTMIDLLDKVLPKIDDFWFPLAKDLKWLEEDHFKTYRLLSAEEEKQRLIEEYERLIALKNREIDLIQREEKFLTSILISDGDQLKNDVKKILEKIIDMTGSSLGVVKAADDEEMITVDEERRDDLRIFFQRGTKVILIDVEGSERRVKPGILNRLSIHRRTFLRYHPHYRLDDLFSLLLINHEYEGGLDPRNREELFHPEIADAEERMVADQFSAMQTYDFFRLYKDLEAGKIVLTEEQLLEFLTHPGVMRYDDLFRREEGFYLERRSS
ncbi:MAG: hypothetical protein HY731_14895 [Candidatus Tectomicrobia bacterium]|nr:hypothetical protein [Candidatus Tectomicrobia bacterium]